MLTASQRLHNLCDFLAHEKEDSPYSAQSWDELQEENNVLRKRLAIKEKEFEQLKAIHEACASELYFFKYGGD